MKPDPQDEFTQLQKLLRLKQYEKPDTEYFEDFLLEFQRRQRAGLLHRSLWQKLSDRLEDLIGPVRVPSYAYATMGLLAVAVSAWILSVDEIGGSMAAAPPEPASALRLDVNPPAEFFRPATIPSRQLVGTLPPHYDLQSRPSSQHEPYSF